jgi:hypothetical protein
VTVSSSDEKDWEELEAQWAKAEELFHEFMDKTSELPRGMIYVTAIKAVTSSLRDDRGANQDQTRAYFEPIIRGVHGGR